MRHGILITGTDTGVGKTVICRLLAAYVQRQGIGVITQKWVQTGGDEDDDVREHALRLTPGQCGVADLEHKRMVYRLQYPASPHLAAALEGQRIDPAAIEAAYTALKQAFELVLVEGSGGALVPLHEELLLADLARRLDLGAVVVVRNALGAINHGLLTIEALRARGLPLLGIIFNRCAPGGDETILRDNVRSVGRLGGVPVLGELPFGASTETATPNFAPIGDAFLEQWQRS